MVKEKEKEKEQEPEPLVEYKSKITCIYDVEVIGEQKKILNPFMNKKEAIDFLINQEK